MKKYIAVIFLMLLYPFPVMGDEVEDGLANMATEQVRTHTRAMVAAGVPAPDAVKMTRMMIQNHYRQQNVLKAQKSLIEAVKKGLPKDPVLNKAYEGMAKNVPQDMVVQAMETVRHRYTYAYRVADDFTKSPAVKQTVGSMIAKGLAAGITEQDMEQTREMLRQRTRQMTQTRTTALVEESFLALQAMARRGVPSETSKDVVCQALQSQYNAREMNQLRHSFMTQSVKMDPNRLAQQYAQKIGQGSLESGHGPNRPASGDSGGSGGSGNSGGSGSSGGSGDSGSSDGSGGGSGGSGGSGGGGSGGSGGSGK